MQTQTEQTGKVWNEFGIEQIRSVSCQETAELEMTLRPRWDQSVQQHGEA